MKPIYFHSGNTQKLDCQAQHFVFVLWLWLLVAAPGIQGCNPFNLATWNYRTDLPTDYVIAPAVIAPDGSSYLSILDDVSNGSGVDELMLIKIDLAGKEVWKHMFYIQGPEFFQRPSVHFIGPLLDLNGDIIIGYRKECWTFIGDDGVCGEVIEKISSNGTKIWTKAFINDPTIKIVERSKGPVLDELGNTYVAYEIANVNEQYATWVVQYLADGSIGWQTQYARPTIQSTRLDDLAISTDGLELIYLATHDSAMINVAAYTTSGVQQWVHTYPHPDNPQTNTGEPLSGLREVSMLVSPQGNLAITAEMSNNRIARAISNTGSFLFDTKQFWFDNTSKIDIDLSGNLYLYHVSGIIERLAGDGTTLWTYNIGVDNREMPQVRFDQDDAVYFFKSGSIGNNSIVSSIVKLDTTGTPVWRRDQNHQLSTNILSYFQLPLINLMEISKSQQLYLSTTLLHLLYFPGGPPCEPNMPDCGPLAGIPIPLGFSTVTHVYDSNGTQLRKIQKQNQIAEQISAGEQGAFYLGSTSIVYDVINSFPRRFHLTKYKINR